MQNVQALSHPGAIETHARNASPRTAGKAPGNVSVYSLHIHLRTIGLGSLQQVKQVRERVCADHHVDPGGPALDLALVLLRQTARDDDPQRRIRGLRWLEMAEVAIEPVVGVLADGARVEHDHPGPVQVVCGGHTAGHEQACDALRVVLVHLAPEGADLIRAVHEFERIGSWVPPTSIVVGYGLKLRSENPMSHTYNLARM